MDSDVSVAAADQPCLNELFHLWRTLPRRRPSSLRHLCRSAALRFLCDGEHMDHVPALRRLIASRLAPSLRQQLVDDACSACHLSEACLVRVLGVLLWQVREHCHSWTVKLREPLLTPCVRATLLSCLWECGGSVSSLRMPLSTAAAPVRGEMSQLCSLLLCNMQHLSELCLSHLSSAGVQLCSAVAGGCPRLSRLDLLDSPAIDDAALQHLARDRDGCVTEAAASLTHVRLAGCERVTRDGLAVLLTACGCLRVLHHRRTVCAVCELARVHSATSSPAPPHAARQDTDVLSRPSADTLQLQLQQLWQPDTPHSTCSLSEAVRVCVGLRRFVCGQLHQLQPLAECLEVVGRVQHEADINEAVLSELCLHRLHVDAAQLLAVLTSSSCCRRLCQLHVSFSRASVANLAPLLASCPQLQVLEVCGCHVQYCLTEPCSSPPPQCSGLRQVRLQTPADGPLLSQTDVLLLLSRHCARATHVHLQWLAGLDSADLLALVPVSCERLVVAGTAPSARHLARLIAARESLLDVAVWLSQVDTAPQHMRQLQAVAQAARASNLSVEVRVVSRRPPFSRHMSSLSMEV